MGATSGSDAANVGGRQIERRPEPLFLRLDVGDHRSRSSGLSTQPVAEKHDLRQACHLRQCNQVVRERRGGAQRERADQGTVCQVIGDQAQSCQGHSQTEYRCLYGKSGVTEALASAVGRVCLRSAGISRRAD
jgi:hypothetical protein